MLAAAAAAKDRLKSSCARTPGSRGTPPRQPVCSEDEAAHAALMSGAGPRSDAYGSGGAGACPPQYQYGAYGAYPQYMQQAPGGGGGGGSPYYAAGYGQYMQPGGEAASGYAGFSRPAHLGGGSATYGSTPQPYGYGAYVQGDGSSSAHKGDEEDEGGSEEDDEDRGPKVSPFVTCRLVCCYLLLLAIGYSFGAISSELHWEHWTELKKTHAWLEDMEDWLHKPHNDPQHGGAYCTDGLLIDGPMRTGASTLLYLFLLLWSFLGVAIAADVFMAGIEKITSQETTKTIVLKSGEVRRYTITVWNATIANLTLMALGSSAPEILLSVIEIFSSGFYAGELGPSTIVGSAAFNMLVISAVCVVAIPNGGGRLIKELPVFYITAIFSLLAYVWLIVILVVVTPNMVDVWEGLVTLFAFPLLVWMAYRADVDGQEEEVVDDSPEGAAAATAIGYGKDGRAINRTDISRVLALKSVERLSAEEQVQAVASLLLPPQSRAHYRKAATSFALGRKEAAEDGAGAPSAAAIRSRIMEAESEFDADAPAIVQWAQPTRLCREAQDSVELALTRSGNTSSQVSVRYSSASGTATEGLDFEAARGYANFRPGQTSTSINVKIIDDDEEEDDETFTVEISHPSNGCMLGECTVCEVTIQDDDGPGELHFESREIEVYESAKKVDIVVLRTHGCQGKIGCHWATRDGSCRSPQGFVSGAGYLEFGEGVQQQTITLEIVDTGAYHRDDDFQVVLSSASKSRFVTDAATRTRRATLSADVRIGSDADRAAKVDEMISLLDFSQSVGTPTAVLEQDSWADQWSEAFEMPDDGSSLSLVMYVLALPWKIVGALIPPPSYANGWACFMAALVFIGCITALIGDLAAHMGCCMGLSNSVTAITFVALGTSLPDTFASMSAATSEPYADASIVNITGSNSVNVFLGLGLPWAAAAIYWAMHGDEMEGMWRKRYKDEPWYNSDTPVGFAVPAGDLAYSVSVFCCCSLVCLATLVGRRKVLGFELGGPPILAFLTFLLFVGLWFAYIYLSVQNSNSLAAAAMERLRLR